MGEAGVLFILEQVCPVKQKVGRTLVDFSFILLIFLFPFYLMIRFTLFTEAVCFCFFHRGGGVIFVSFNLDVISLREKLYIPSYIAVNTHACLSL